ncbi:unnamed protein product [Rhizoctonia solani]|uniref:Uncharacterized protein n=1 Tax=Rhizoctonia solani TaxID=456999 RepID=A0A8H3CLI3_9AGAM|nr:unnamed protein product [Rhizoctonia solani]
MDSPHCGSDSPTMTDKDRLAAAVALASDALATAMEALSEATEAMSDAGLINGCDEYTRGLNNIASLFRTIRLAGEKLVAPEITANIVESSSPDQANHSYDADRQSVPRCENNANGELDAVPSTPFRTASSLLNSQNGSNPALIITHNAQDNVYLDSPPDHKSTKSDTESETEANNEGWQDPENQYVETGEQAQSLSEQIISISSPAPSVSSDSKNEVEPTTLNLPPGSQTAGSDPPQREEMDEGPDLPDTLQSEHESEINAPPEAPVRTSLIDGHESIPNVPAVEVVVSDPHPYEDVLEHICTIMEVYPKIPPGQNYIQLNQESDALAFTAYMSLQANRTFCLLPDQLSVMCSKLVRRRISNVIQRAYHAKLKHLTQANIHRITSVAEFQRICTVYQTTPLADSYDILLVSSDLLDFVSLRNIHCDCVLHWGQPLDANIFISRALAFLPPTTKVCIMMGQQYFNGLVYGVAPYPNLVLATCANAQSPFQLLRKLSVQLLSGYEQGTYTQSLNSNLPIGEREVKVPYSVGPHGVLDTDQNNKFDVSPQSPVMGTSNVHDLAPRPFQDDPLGAGDPQLHKSQPMGNVESHPPIPPGRNYIHLDESSAVLAFIAYMALRVERIICVIPDNCLGLYPELFTSLTHATIHLLDALEDGLAAADNIDPASCHIFFVPYNLSNLDTFIPILSPDCIVYFAPPAGAFYYILQTPLSPNVRSCVIVTEADDLNMKSYEVEPYPDAFIDACFHTDSPFQLLFEVASQLLQETHSEAEPEYASGSHLHIPHSNPSYALDTIDSDNLEEFMGPLPLGHYYIVLDNANDKDIISMIAHIAMNTSKVICYIPKDKNLSQYQRLINLLTGVNAIVPDTGKYKKFKPQRNKQLKAAKKRLKSGVIGVLLRTIVKDWYSFLSNSLADSLIYCGVPTNLSRCKY